MPVVFDNINRCYVPGKHSGNSIMFCTRIHWRDVLTESEQSFLDSVIRAGIKSEDELDLWKRIHEKVLSEGWSGWRLIEGSVRGLSLIPVDSTLTPHPINLGPWKPPRKPGPMAGTLDGFVHED